MFLIWTVGMRAIGLMIGEMSNSNGECEMATAGRVRRLMLFNLVTLPSCRRGGNGQDLAREVGTVGIF